MITCPVCGTVNDNGARYCGECGSVLPVVPARPRYEHDFTTGVMRYQPDTEKEAEQTPVYLTAQAADVLRMQEQPEVQETAPAKKHRENKVRSAVPRKKDVPGAHKKKKNMAAVIITAVIGILVILIVAGIAILLGG